MARPGRYAGYGVSIPAEVSVTLGSANTQVDICLRACYDVPGTDTACVVVRCCPVRAMPGPVLMSHIVLPDRSGDNPTDLGDVAFCFQARTPLCLRACCDTPGTDVLCGATRDFAYPYVIVSEVAYSPPVPRFCYSMRGADMGFASAR